MHSVSILYINTERNSFKDTYRKYFDLCEPKRRARIRNSKSEKVKEELLYAGVLLQAALKEKGLNRGVISYGEAGKPYTEGVKDFCFNISHSGDYVAIAFSDVNIGFDLQKPVSAKESLIKRIASEREIKEKEDLINNDFPLFWAIKESYAKYTGKGIGTDFVNLSFEVRDGEIEYFENGCLKAYGSVIDAFGGYGAVLCAGEAIKTETIKEIIL